MTAEDKILDAGYEDVIIFGNQLGESYDDALVGISNDGRAIYDFDLMINYLMRNNDMSCTDAIEWIEYNTIRSLPYAGDKAPIIMYRLDE